MMKRKNYSLISRPFASVVAAFGSLGGRLHYKTTDLTQQIERKTKVGQLLLNTRYLKLTGWSILSLLLISWCDLPLALGQENRGRSDRQITQPTPTTAIARPILKIGSQGVAVAELQAALKLLGYYTGTVDGTYGESTATAVSRFQQAAGLNSDGVVGTATWERLFPPTPRASTRVSTTRSSPPTPQPTPTQPTTNNATTVSNSPTGDLPILKLGMRGPAVFWLQQRLQTTGFFQGEVDGIFGSATEDAVKAAQRRYKLNADGIVGIATWRAILPQ